MSKPETALGNVALGLLSGIAVLVSTEAPIFPGIPLIMTGLGGAATIAHRHRKHELAPKDYLDGLNELLEDADQAISPMFSWIEAKAEPIAAVTIPELPGIDKILAQRGSEVASSRTDWMTTAFFKRSHFVLGAKGSGKSIYMKTEVRAIKKADPQAQIWIIDPHKGASRESDGELTWLPGVPETDYLIKDMAQAMAVIQEVEAELDRRINDPAKPRSYLKLVIDEFQAFLMAISKEDQEYTQKVIQRIQDEADKYNIQITISAKSLKQKQTGIDSSVLWQMDVLALGKSLEDRTCFVPAGFDREGALASLKATKSIPGCTYSFIYVPFDDDYEIRVLPDDLNKRLRDDPGFVVGAPVDPADTFIAEWQDQVFGWLAQGRSVTKIAEAIPDFGKRADSNYKWTALKSLRDIWQAQTMDTQLTTKEDQIDD